MLNGVSYLSFEDITIDHAVATYGNCIRVDGKSGNLSFKGIIFNGVEVPRTGANSSVIYFSSNAPKSNISFDDCEINNAIIGIYKGGVCVSEPDTKTSITGTLFYNQYESGLALIHEDAPVIASNVITTLSIYNDYKALSLDDVSNALVISNNIITAANGSTGIVLNNCLAAPDRLGQINNNSISVGGTGKTSELYLLGNTNIHVLNFNRIKLTVNNKNEANQAYYRNEGSGNNINLMNNILYYLTTGGYTILGNTYKDIFIQLPGQSNPSLSVSANGIMIEKVLPIK